MPERFKNYLKRQNLSGLAALAGIILFYIVLEGIGITCPILFLTGVSCAGCGMSRAWLSLLQGNPEMAFYYHPLFWMPPVVLLLWILRRRIPYRILRFLFWSGCALFLIVYAARMMNPEDSIVVFHPTEGLVGRAVTFLFQYFKKYSA